MTPNSADSNNNPAKSPLSRDFSAALPVPGDMPWALFLDVDGTLVELAAVPDAVHVDVRLVTLLNALHDKLDGAMALVSGRTITTLDRLFSPLQLPAAGNHGLERRSSGGQIKRPELEAKATDLADNLISLARENLFLQHGKKMVEIRPGQGDKGTAIAEFLAKPPFTGCLPVFVGDDVTDEQGFKLVNQHGGHSIRVGNDVTTAARYHVADFNGVIRWPEDMVKA